MIAPILAESGGLSFLPSGTSLGVGLVALTATAVLCWIAWSRKGFRRTSGLLELLRFVLVGMVVVTLFQPEWLEVEPAEQRSTLAVLWDDSKSMDFSDVLSSTGGAEKPQTRAESIEPLLRESFWKPAGGESRGEDWNVVFESFSSELDPPREATDLHAGLARVLDSHSDLRGVVLVSDGDWNTGKSPAEAASRYRRKGIPVYTVSVGSEEALPDLELVSMEPPTFGIVDKPLRLPFVVRSTMGQDRDLSVTLSVDGEAVTTVLVRVPAMGQVERNLVWKPNAIGTFEVGLSFPPDEGEIRSENNAKSVPIPIQEEELMILVIDSYPRWEYRYLRNALERDPGVDVRCLLFHPELDKKGGGRDYLESFPAPNDLLEFDVVFLGDVGIGPGSKELTKSQAQELRSLVSSQASGLVFLPGRHGNQTSLLASPLKELLPVVLDLANPFGRGSSAPGHFTLTGAGQRSLLTRLAETDQENADLWRRLPGFHWHAGVLRAKAGTEVLAVHDRDTGSAGRAPLLVTKTYGTGKVLYMATDTAWRWREGVEDTYHYRFWAQVARWMAYQRQQAEGQSMRLFFSPDRPRVGDVLTLYANVQDSLGAPLLEGSVLVEVSSSTGKKQTIRLEPGAEDRSGLFVGSFVCKQAGSHGVAARCPETLASVSTELSVEGQSREREGAVARYDVLEEVAAITKGRMVPVLQAKNLVDQLAALPAPQPTMYRMRLWSHPIWCGILIALLCVFWIGRKMDGAV